MKSAFPGMNRIVFEGPGARKPLAFEHYRPDDIVEGNAMRDHLLSPVVIL
jgi:xylose isomerase